MDFFQYTKFGGLAGAGALYNICSFFYPAWLHVTRYFYSLLFYLITPIILLRLFYRGIKEPSYKSALGERFGFVRAKPSAASTRPIWVHAVSAGETIAAKALIESLLAMGHEVVVSNMTPTGKAQVEALFAGRVRQVYVPYDLPDVLARFLKRINPSALLIIDTELWPNMVHACWRREIPVVLVNGRLSEKSARGYQRFSWLSRPMLQRFSKICVQTETQGQRFLSLGLEPNKLNVTGSIKFDAVAPDNIEDKIDRLKLKFARREVFLAASTHEGEEAVVLEALSTQGADSLLVLAPRHPHRAVEVAKMIQVCGFAYVTHSGSSIDSYRDDGTLKANVKVYLLDTMGELLSFYGASDLALVCGSLVDSGGHNPMEPASLGIPMMMGPYRRNIDDIATEFNAAGAMEFVSDGDDLAAKWFSLMEAPMQRQQMSDAALTVMAANRGALLRIVAAIEPFLD